MLIFKSGLNRNHIWGEPPCLLWERLFLLVRWTILHPPLLCLQCLPALHTLILNPLPLFKTCLDIIFKKALLILSCPLPSGWAPLGISVFYHICYLCCSTVYVSPSPKLLWALWRWGLFIVVSPASTGWIPGSHLPKHPLLKEGRPIPPTHPIRTLSSTK